LIQIYTVYKASKFKGISPTT